ncbi:MAG: hypothetical protein AAFR04_16210 [Pseudomonadota bacterium]
MPTPISDPNASREQAEPVDAATDTKAPAARPTVQTPALTAPPSEGEDLHTPPLVTFEPGAVRKSALCLAFLLLLPFYVSLPAMLAMRLSYGLWGSTVGLGLLALAFTAIMIILWIQLNHAVRTYVTIGADKVKFNVPRNNGPTPFLRYTTTTLNLDDIIAVETHRECYGAPVVPVLLRTVILVTRDGSRHKLGYVHANDTDSFPLMRIAEMIAARAGIAIRDGGIVERSVRAEVAQQVAGFTYQSLAPRAIKDVEIERYNARHRSIVVVLVVLLTVALAVGIGVDVMRAGSTA